MKNSRIIAIIPARMGSSRFPGKPLAKILGMPMIGHVYKRTVMCNKLAETYVATCDNEIADYVYSLGGKVIMTSSEHQRASDRTAEAMLKAESELGYKVDIVVMVQGDEPMLSPAMIEKAVDPMIGDDEILAVNLMAPLKNQAEQEDKNEVKVVTDTRHNALYFSREPIPSGWRGVEELPMYKQVCIIPFRRDFLLEFNRLRSTPLEIAESIDMLRVLEHGLKVKMVLSEVETYSVDTPDDLARVEVLMGNDMFIREYSGIAGNRLVQ